MNINSGWIEKTIEIIIDGKTYQAQMSVDEIKKLVEKPVRTGYERAEKRNKYYCAWNYINASNHIETNDSDDCSFYNTANYYTDKTLAENNARADKLMRQLRRFAVEENAKAGVVLDWDGETQKKFKLSFFYGQVQTDCVRYTKDFGQIYFATVEIARKAIETFKDELMWYFMEYKDYYVEEEKDDWLM